MIRCGVGPVWAGCSLVCVKKLSTQPHTGTGFAVRPRYVASDTLLTLMYYLRSARMFFSVLSLQLLYACAHALLWLCYRPEHGTQGHATACILELGHTIICV